MLGQELLPGDEEQRAELAPVAELNELDPCKKFDACEPRRQGNVSKRLVQTRWALTW